MAQATPLLAWLQDRDLPVFLALQGTALVAAGITFGARLFSLRIIGWPRAERNVQLVRYAGAAAVGCVAGGALLGPLIRLPRALAGRGDPFAPGFIMAWGAIGGATIGATLAARAHRTSGRAGASPLAVGPLAWRVLDALAPALGVLVAIGRLGCVLAGCCFGDPTAAAWALAYPRGTPAHVEHVHRGWIAPDAVASLPVVPVAVLESMLGVAMIVVGMKLARRGRRGSAFLAVVATYAGGRLALEQLRDDLGRGPGLGVASLLSLGALALCVAAACRRRD